MEPAAGQHLVHASRTQHRRIAEAADRRRSAGGAGVSGQLLQGNNIINIVGAVKVVYLYDECIWFY